MLVEKWDRQRAYDFLTKKAPRETVVKDLEFIINNWSETGMVTNRTFLFTSFIFTQIIKVYVRNVRELGSIFLLSRRLDPYVSNDLSTTLHSMYNECQTKPANFVLLP